MQGVIAAVQLGTPPSLCAFGGHLTSQGTGKGCSWLPTRPLPATKLRCFSRGHPGQGSAPASARAMLS